MSPLGSPAGLMVLLLAVVGVVSLLRWVCRVIETGARGVSARTRAVLWMVAVCAVVVAVQWVVLTQGPDPLIAVAVLGAPGLLAGASVVRLVNLTRPAYRYATGGDPR